MLLFYRFLLDRFEFRPAKLRLLQFAIRPRDAWRRGDDDGEEMAPMHPDFWLPLFAFRRFRPHSSLVYRRKRPMPRGEFRAWRP